MGGVDEMIGEANEGAEDGDSAFDVVGRETEGQGDALLGNKFIQSKGIQLGRL